jgi:hypothetical protein
VLAFPVGPVAFLVGTVGAIVFFCGAGPLPLPQPDRMCCGRRSGIVSGEGVDL